jgi:hypothetical protein
MAMRDNKNKMTLSAIYAWIRENFIYYRIAEPSWQNSIRHNLSLNRCFMKVARSKDEPGKGGFWRLDPAFSESLDNGEKPYRLRKRRNPPKNKNKNKDGSNVVKPPQSHQPGVTPLGNNNTTPNMTAPTQLQHCCDDLSCVENQNHHQNQMVAQEMEIQLHITDPPQISSSQDSSPHHHQHQQNFLAPHSPSVGSVPPNILQHIQTHQSPSLAYSPPEGITLLQNIQMIDSSPESANILHSGNFLELTAAERIFDSNGECVYVLCTDQSLSSLNINLSNCNDVNTQGNVQHIQLSSMGTCHNTANAQQQYLSTSESCAFPMSIENTIEIPMEGGVGSEISRDSIKLTLADVTSSLQAHLDTITTTAAISSSGPSIYSPTSQYGSQQSVNTSTATTSSNFHPQNINGNIQRIHLHPVNENGAITDGPGSGGELATLTNASEVIEISTLAADIEKESNHYAITRGVGYTTTATAAIVGSTGIGQDLGTITWDERCGPSINFLETELDLEELIMSGEL